MQNRPMYDESPGVKLTKFPCITCKQMFASELLINEHYKSGTCNVPEENEMVFSSDRHSYSATEASDHALDSPTDEAQTSPFVCAACGECFTDYKQLTLHDCADSRKAIYSCDTCGKSYSSRLSLYSHVQLHLNKQIKCEVCDKSYTSRSYLSTHMRTHTGTKPYSCEHCEKSFTQRSSLIRHMTVHSEKKPFTCRSCFKHFSDRRNYVLHLQAHMIVK